MLLLLVAGCGRPESSTTRTTPTDTGACPGEPYANPTWQPYTTLDGEEGGACVDEEFLYANLGVDFMTFVRDQMEDCSQLPPGVSAFRCGGATGVDVYQINHLAYDLPDLVRLYFRASDGLLFAYEDLSPVLFCCGDRLADSFWSGEVVSGPCEDRHDYTAADFVTCDSADTGPP